MERAVFCTSPHIQVIMYSSHICSGWKTAARHNLCLFTRSPTRMQMDPKRGIDKFLVRPAILLKAGPLRRAWKHIRSPCRPFNFLMANTCIYFRRALFAKWIIVVVEAAFLPPPLFGRWNGLFEDIQMQSPPSILCRDKMSSFRPPCAIIYIVCL